MILKRSLHFFCSSICTCEMNMKYSVVHNDEFINNNSPNITKHIKMTCRSKVSIPSACYRNIRLRDLCVWPGFLFYIFVTVDSIGTDAFFRLLDMSSQDNFFFLGQQACLIAYLYFRCFRPVSRTEAEVLLERHPDCGNMLLRPGRDGTSLAVTTRQDLNG